LSNTPVTPVERKVTIVVLAKYKEIFQGFVESVEKIAPNFQKVLVADGTEVLEVLEALPAKAKSTWTVIPGPEKFAMAGNGNLGLKAVPSDSDILYVGDDVRFLHEKTVERLQEYAYREPTIGILSPRLLGRASNALANPSADITFIRPMEMWFPCVYIKRELIEKIGYLDERFNDFGSDDLDYCIRAQIAGYKLAATSFVTVQHEMSVEGGPTTFVKKLGVAQWQQQQAKALEKLREKYEVSIPIFERALRSGDSKLLVKKTIEVIDQTKKKPPTPEEAKKILEKRSIYIATPAYGGMMTVNYVTSLLGINDICRNYNVKLEYSFVYNESLITRARNKMVFDYLNKSSCTDFFFIDADISFDPKDIVSLLFHDEPIIGCPCVRKNLRFDRVAAAVKRNPDKEYTIDEMARMCGEFVVNFPPTGAPQMMNLGQLIEVQDVGTGIMRVRREVFEEIEKKFPDRYYVPMQGEGEETQPHYMFFQSCIDAESGKFNPGGYPHYIAEDFAFCRLAQKAGFKIYLAPWIKSDHMGALLFKGDLEMVAKVGGGLRRA